MLDLANDEDANGTLVVADTQGILRPGSKQDWLNEIHPTESGFKKVYNKVYKEMRRLEPNLPR